MNIHLASGRVAGGVLIGPAGKSSGAGIECVRHLHLGKLRQILRELVLQAQPSLLHQLHYRQHGDHLGGRVQIVQLVSKHRTLSQKIAVSGVVAVQHLVVLHHLAVQSRDAIALSQAVQIFCQFFKSHRHFSPSGKTAKGGQLKPDRPIACFHFVPSISSKAISMWGSQKAQLWMPGSVT